MSIIHLIDPLLLYLPHAASGDTVQHVLGQIPLAQSIDLHHPFHTTQTILAQQFETDVFKGARASFNNFVRSGQAWALLIGIVVGYIFRSLTSYG